MLTGASFQHSKNGSDGGLAPRVPFVVKSFLVFAAIFVSISILSAAQQAATGAAKVQSSAHGASAKSPSPFLEAETLLQQGSIDEAKKKIQEQLAIKPSVEGYNLLGIVYSSQKDYDNALDSFQHALKIDPNSTKTATTLAISMSRRKGSTWPRKSSER